MCVNFELDPSHYFIKIYYCKLERKIMYICTDHIEKCTGIFFYLFDSESNVDTTRKIDPGFRNVQQFYECCLNSL